MLLALILLAAAGGGPPPMRVCYGHTGAPLTDCSDLADGDFIPPPERQLQAFALVRPAAHEIRLGISGLAPMSEAGELETIVEKADSATAVDIAVAGRWLFAMPARELAGVHRIRLPAVGGRIVLRAPHYHDASADLAPKMRIVLRRLPVIQGRIIGFSGAPLANVPVLPGCVTGLNGGFRCEIGGEWPRSLSIASTGSGTRIVVLDPVERDTDLGDIRLSRGARLTIKVTAPPQIRTLELTLFRDEVEITKRRVAMPEPASIEDLEPGDYRLLIRGDRPLEQRGEMVAIKDGDNDRAIAIEPADLTLNVFSGARAEPAAAVTLKSLDGRWSGSVQTGDSGSVTEALWQLGTFTAAVRTKGASSPFLDHREFAAGDTQQWTFRLPIARIDGTVVNEAGEPVGGAVVYLTTDDGEVSSALHTRSDDAGRYAFDGIRSGAQTVSAEGEGYMPSKAIEFRIADGESGRRVDLTLDRGKSKRIEIVDSRGVPLSATIFEAIDNALVSTYTTQPDGAANVQLPPEGSALLIAVPASGSFAIHRVTSADRDLPTLRIGVRDPACSLDLKTETTDHKSIGDIHFLVRFDGEVIPFDVLMNLAQRSGIDFTTGASGMATVVNLPPGLYELWPYATPADVQAVMVGADVPPPLRIAVVPGENAATLTFRAKHR